MSPGDVKAGHEDTCQKEAGNGELVGKVHGRRLATIV
jgi:hypothetical protein